MTYCLSDAFVTFQSALRDRIERRWGVKVVQRAQQEPITMADAALHLRLDVFGSPGEYPDQLLVEAQIVAAREYCEAYTGRALAPQRLMLQADSFPAERYIELPMGPVRGVDAVEYWDGTAYITMGTADYIVDAFCEPARVYLETAGAWPTVTTRPGALRITYAAGYTLPDDSPDEAPLPFQIRAAMLLMLGNLYENRETIVVGTISSEIPLSIKALLDPYKLRLGFM